MIIGPSGRPEVTFSLLWPFRRSASTAEKFVAELSSMRIWSYDVNNKLWTYEVNKGCEVMYVVLCELALFVATTLD